MTNAIAKVETPYEDLLKEVFETGTHKGDRTGTGTVSVFGPQISYDLTKGFPLLTTKLVSFRLIASELVWFLQGNSNIRYLLQHDNHIWSEWPFKAYLQQTRQPVPTPNSPEWDAQLAKYERRVLEDESFAKQYGDLGPVYGVQWRSWPLPGGGSLDQIEQVVADIKRDPDSRRLIVTAWNPAEVPQMKLPPCHAMFQFYVVDGVLSCKLTQRSSDMFLGVPFNIASYALLTHMVAQQCDLEVGTFIWSSGDTHIYDNHREQVALQLSREPRPYPTLRFARRPESIFDYQVEDFIVENYNPHPFIAAPVAV